MADPSFEAQLAAFAAEAVPSEPARMAMRASLLDWAACGLAGASEPVARALRALALDEGGAAVADLFGGGTVPARAAALVNGATSHALDYDDTHFDHIGHPSVAVIPAALAMAQMYDRHLDALVDAALIGAEASIRVGTWLGRGHYQVGFHQTATAGSFGATLAAARLMGLGHEQTVQALGLVSTRAAGLKAQFGTMGKPLNAGLAAEAGVMAATWAGAGLSSTARGLTDPQGFGATHHGAGAAEAFQALGRHWRFTGITHKYHACCHGTHAALDAVAALELAPASLASLEIATHSRWLTVCDIAAPETGLEVKFSYRHTAAMVLAGYDTTAIASFCDAVATDPTLVALARRVTVVADDGLSETAARVRATDLSGRTAQATADISAPLDPETRAARLAAKAESLVGARAPALVAACQGRTLGSLVALLAP